MFSHIENVEFELNQIKYEQMTTQEWLESKKAWDRASLFEGSSWVWTKISSIQTMIIQTECWSKLK